MPPLARGPLVAQAHCCCTPQTVPAHVWRRRWLCCWGGQAVLISWHLTGMWSSVSLLGGKHTAAPAQAPASAERVASHAAALPAAHGSCSSGMMNTLPTEERRGVLGQAAELAQRHLGAAEPAEQRGCQSSGGACHGAPDTPSLVWLTLGDALKTLPTVVGGRAPPLTAPPACCMLC